MGERANNVVRAVRWCILIFWITMMGVLVQKVYFDPEGGFSQPSYAASHLRPREEWMGVYWGEDKVGYTVSTIKKEYKGYEIYEQAIMDLTVMGTPQKVDTQVTTHVDNAFMLKSFEFRLFSNLFTFNASGRMRGKELHLKILSGKSASTRVVPMREVPVLANSLKPMLLSQGVAVGKRFTYTIFDPSTMSTTPIEVVVDGKDTVVLRGKEIECYRLKSSFRGISIKSWLDDEGNTIKEESPLGLILVKESKADALTEGWSETTKDLIGASAIQVNRPIAVRNPSYLKVRLGNVNFEEFALSKGRQTLRGDVLEVVREKMADVSSYQLPYGKDGMDEYLSATTFIQSDDQAIVQQAREIIGDEKDAQKAVQLIKEWVYQNIKKKPTLSIPSALDILKVKVGDCNEHATLFVALSRAVGIPSKLCAGIVYMQGSFYYHAWSEVFIGRWISVDPTTNQLPADATHICFVEGGLDKQLEIIQLIGVVQVEVLEYK